MFRRKKHPLLFSFIASEEVTLQLVKSKCLPILLYGLECYSMLKADLHSLDFVVMRFLMKLFRTANKNTVLTRRVSSYGLPAWVSSELGAICCGVLPEPDL